MRHAELDESAEIRRLQEKSRQTATAGGQTAAGGQPVAGRTGNENVDFQFAFATDANEIMTKATAAIQAANAKEQKTVQQQYTATLNKLYNAHTASVRQYYNHQEQLAKQQIEAAKQKLKAVQSQKQTVLDGMETAHTDLKLQLDMAASDDQSVFSGLSSNVAAYNAVAVASSSASSSVSSLYVEVKQEAEEGKIKENGAVQVDEHEDEHDDNVVEVVAKVVAQQPIDLTKDDD